MNRFLGRVVVLTFSLGIAVISLAEEPAVAQAPTPAAEQGVVENAANLPTDADIRQVAAEYVTEQTVETGTFDVYDSEIEDIRELSFESIQEKVGKTADGYFVCANFKDTKNGDLIDVDLDLENQDGKLGVVDVRIHKINDKELYAYDASGNRIPVVEAGAPAPVVTPPAGDSAGPEAQP